MENETKPFYMENETKPFYKVPKPAAIDTS